MRRLLRKIGFDVIRWPAGTAEGTELATILRLLQVTTVLDVGAYVGGWASQLRRLGYEGSIVSFEPNPRAYAALSRAAASDPLWKTVPVAVGAEHGEANLRVRANPQMTSLLDTSDDVLPSYSQAARVVERGTVRLVRLDECWPGGQAFLKVDTQGSELDVIRGCGSRLADVVGLLIECTVVPTYRDQPLYLDVLHELDRLGFTPVTFLPFFWDDGRRLVEFDCLLRRK